MAVAARADGYEAVRYPSAAVARERPAREVARPAAPATQEDPLGAANLAVFADALHPGSDARVVRSEVLPLDDA